MERVCEYCGKSYNEKRKRCPHCGTPNRAVDRDCPKTVEGLRNYCKNHDVDPHSLHFHIGSDYRGARAYGIYRDTDGKFVVYKNHRDKRRTELFRDADEGAAVAVLYAKLQRARFGRRKHRRHREGNLAHATSGGRTAARKVASHGSVGQLLTAGLAIILLLAALFLHSSGAI